MADRVLREACEHGRFEAHWWEHGANPDRSKRQIDGAAGDWVEAKLVGLWRRFR